VGQLSGKVAIITGGASGMGRATSLLFAREGANVVVADLNVPDGEEVAKLASESGGKSVFQRTDVSSEAEIAALVARALSDFGRLDVTFNNAGIGGAIGSLQSISVEDWDRTQAVCLRGVFLGIKHSIAPMRAGGGGAIISTSSAGGVGGHPGGHAYGAAKAGVINLTRSAAIEFAPDNIRVNCIVPGMTATPMADWKKDKQAMEQHFATLQPLNRAGQPEDIANAALFLATDNAGFITGHSLVVDGGALAGAGSLCPRPEEVRARRGPSQMVFDGPSFER
jgi:NAD(P)-dependent dehydrogenase (short-subunit alcohol dehydrogenase family)